MLKQFRSFQFVFLTLLFTCYVNVAEKAPEECSVLKKTQICPENVWYRPWPNDEDCKKYNVTLLNKDDPREPTALAMFPITGNSAIGQMIQELSGIYVSNLHPTLVIHNTIKNCTEFCLLKSSSTFTHKTLLQRTVGSFYDLIPIWFLRNRRYSSVDISLQDLSTIMFDYRGFLFVRNPWIALSEFRGRVRNAFRKHGCTQCVKSSVKRSLRSEIDFETENFQDFMEAGAELWVNSMKEWISKSPHGSELIIIKYEDFVENSMPELTRVMKYLNLALDEGRLNCTMKHRPTVQRCAFPLATRPSVSVQLRGFQRVNQLLTHGIDQVNKLLTEKGINTRLDYSQS